MSGSVSAAPRRERIQIIDAMRGLSIVLMVLHHLGIDLVSAGVMPPSVVYNPLVDVLSPVFAGLFILLSGVSSRFSRSNLRRGLVCFLFAVGVSLVTGLFSAAMGMSGSDDFGILHFLGLSMMIYGLAERVLQKIPFQPFLWGGLFVVCKIFFPIRLTDQVFAGSTAYLPWFGFLSSEAVFYDYFPLLPWLFLFLFGTWLGGPIRDGKFPGWFYRFRMPVLPFIGRHTLVIYLVHQPVILGVLMLLGLW